MESISKRPIIHFGNQSYLVDNSSFIYSGLSEKKDCSYIELDRRYLATIGYTREGLDRLLNRFKEKTTAKIVHLSFENQEIERDYNPSINLMSHEFCLESITAKVNELIELSHLQANRKDYQTVCVSFSKVYLTDCGPKSFVAHASPLIISKVKNKTLLFIFEEVGNEIAKKISRINHHVYIYSINGLIHSPLNCNTFTLSMIEQFTQDPMLIDYIFEKNRPTGQIINVGLFPPFLPSKLMRFSESIQAKLCYLSAITEPLACRFIDAKDILTAPSAQATLVKIKRISIVAEEKNISTTLYLKNIDYALILNMEEAKESKFYSQLIEEKRILLENEKSIRLLDDYHSPSSTLNIKKTDFDQVKSKSHMISCFYKRLSPQPFLCLSRKELPVDFRSFSEAFVLDDAYQLFSFFDFIEKLKAPPLDLFHPDHYRVPLKGMMALLGVSRAIADIDILGVDGARIGFIWIKNQDGQAVEAQVVKIIDDDCPFVFEKKIEHRLTCNLVINTQKKLGPSSCWLQDLRDIQTQVFVSDKHWVILWKSLSDKQQAEFKGGMIASQHCIKQHNLIDDLDMIYKKPLKSNQTALMSWVEDQCKIYELN